MEIVFLNKISSDCRNTFGIRKHSLFCQRRKKHYSFSCNARSLLLLCIHWKNVQFFLQIGNFRKENYIVSVFGNMSKNLLILKFIWGCKKKRNTISYYVLKCTFCLHGIFGKHFHVSETQCFLNVGDNFFGVKSCSVLLRSLPSRA